MNEANFHKQFSFNIFEFNNYHLTDNSRVPIPVHYFGCLIEGRAIIKTSKIELPLEPGEIFYIPKGLKYQSQWFGEKVRFYSFGFETSPINKSFVLQKTSCCAKANEVFDELCKNIPFTEKGIGKLYYFFELVADGMTFDENASPNPTVAKAIECITDNPYIKTADVAKYCSVSEPTIYLLFKKHLHKTPNEVRLSIKCEKAIAMLTTTDKSVQEISDALNFSSTSYFRKIIKAHTDKTPMQLRKESIF